jgi:hypothetical protein
MSDELLDNLALKLDLANMELHAIDEILARRPALANAKLRTEKIERACSAAGELDGLLRKYGAHRDGCVAHPDCICGWDQVKKQLRQVGQ